MVILLTFALLVFSDAPEQPDHPAVWKVARCEGRMGRSLFISDPVLLKLAEDPDFAPDWEEEVTEDEDGVVSHEFLRNGWAYSEYESSEKRTVLLEGGGFHSLFVNGEPFAGDYYSHGLLRIPVPLKQGTNRFLVRAMRRGRFNLDLISSRTCARICCWIVMAPW
jgi:hypothetical protein